VVMKQKASEIAAAPVVADRLEYNLRTEKAVQGDGELVDALSRGDVKLESVKNEQLPAELQKLSQAELKTYVDKKQAERAGLQKRLNDLIARRSAYLDAEKKRLGGNKRDAFDESVAETIRTEAARKGITYDKKK
jgi:hypothetical protein